MEKKINENGDRRLVRNSIFCDLIKKKCLMF